MSQSGEGRCNCPHPFHISMLRLFVLLYFVRISCFSKGNQLSRPSLWLAPVLGLSCAA